MLYNYVKKKFYENLWCFHSFYVNLKKKKKKNTQTHDALYIEKEEKNNLKKK